MAIQEENCDMIELLVQRGAHLREKDYNIDPLRKAWECRRPDSIHCLVKCSAVIGQSPNDPSMQELLNLAVSRGHCGLADVCLKAGVDPNIQDTRVFGYGTIFQWACGLGYADVVSVFLKYGANHKAIHKSFANGCAQSNKPLYVAASSGHAAVVRVPLEHGVQADIHYMVFRAVHVGYTDLLECLFKYGDVRSKCSQYLDEALLHLAEHLDGRRMWYPATARFPMMIKFLIAQDGRALYDYH